MTKKRVAAAPAGTSNPVPSSPLTTGQMRYASNRLHELAEALIERRIKALPPFPECPDLTNDEKVALILAGKAKLLRKGLSGYIRLVDAYGYPEHDRAVAAWTKRNKARAAKVDQIRDSVNVDRGKLQDEIALGTDGTTVLAKLEAFAAMK